MNDKNMNDENKEEQTLNEQDWKTRFNDLVQSCQNELKRTTQIGMKMLTASQSNMQLHESYEELGRLAKNALNDGSLSWGSSEARDLVEKIEGLEEELEGLEKEVHDIKKS